MEEIEVSERQVRKMLDELHQRIRKSLAKAWKAMTEDPRDEDQH